MAKQYSIAEARDRLASLVHEAERGSRVELTRRGKPVAVILGLHDYRRLHKAGLTFSEAFESFRKKVDLASLGIDPAVFDKTRDRSPGREVHF
jgi:antitoxin Phd